MPEPKKMSICKFCDSLPAEYNGILCEECLLCNTANLLIKCKCGSDTILYTKAYDCIKIMIECFVNGIATMTDLVFTGTGLLLFVTNCPKCSKSKCKCGKNKTCKQES